MNTVNNKKHVETNAMGEKIPFIKTKRFGDTAFAWLMCIIPVIEVIVFFFYLNIDTVALTFQKVNPFHGYRYEFCGLKNYEKLFRDYILGENPACRQTIINSFIPLTLSVVSFPLSYVCAYAFHKHVKFDKFYRIMFYLPSLLSTSVVTLAFKNMFMNQTNAEGTIMGPVTWIVNKLSGESVHFFAAGSQWVWPLMYIFGLFSGLGGNVIIMTAAMNRISPEITESALLDGASFWQESLKITLPLCLPTLYAFIINIPIGLFGFVNTPLMLAPLELDAGNHYTTIGLKLFFNVKDGREAMLVEAATLGVMLSVLWAPVIYGTRWFIGRITPKDVEY